MSKVNKRISAILIDYGVLCALFAVAGFATMFFGSEVLWDSYYMILLICMCIFLCKDIVKGESIGKRISKIKVVDKDGKTPSALKLIIRNITVLIWPLEAYFVIADKKRLGDLLAGTDVIETL